MKRKAIICIFILSILCLSVSCVSAGFLDSLGVSSHTIKVHNGTLSIDDIDFSIPEGYVEDMDSEEIDLPLDENGMHFSKAVFNDTNSSNYIKMQVMYFNDGGTVDNMTLNNSTNKTINGVDGLMASSGNESVFMYLKNDKMVCVGSSSGPDIFEKIIS